uniref:Uncharacterized protein n=1 Tax=Helianthus annuus TaxID=4232 RepID=A0A1Y3BUG6_HELAN
MLRHIQEDIFMKIYYLDKIHNSGAKYKILYDAGTQSCEFMLPLFFNCFWFYNSRG